MATKTGSELDQPTANNKSHTKRTTCDICRERKVRCDRNKPECLRCRRSGYKCTYLSESGNTAKFTVALQELNARLKQAEMMIQTSTRINEENPRRDSPQIQIPISSTDFIASLPDSIEFPEMNQEEVINSWNNMAACDFDAVFDPMEDENQQPDMNQNQRPSQELEATDQMRVTWGDTLALSNGVADLSSSDGCIRIPNVIDDTPQSVKAYDDLIKKYFYVTQKHLPLIDQDKFLQSTVLSATSQAQALKCAICMAGAHVDENSHREEQFYKATRSYLEQAELEVQGSSFWSLEAAQALVLVARYDLTHAKSQRALVTISRLDILVSILQRRLVNPSSGQAVSPTPVVDSSSNLELKRTILLALSLKYRNCTDSEKHDATESRSIFIQSPKLISEAYTLSGQNSLFDRILPSKIESLDSFSIFMLALRITSDAYQHHRETAIDAAGPTVEYNYCHAHDRIDQEIGILVSRLASTESSAESGDNELSVLTMIIILGARILLFNTAILHSSMAGFLKPVVAECLQQNVSTAKDISDMVLQARVLDSARVAIYREASFYIMPALALAAEAHMRLAQANTNKPRGATPRNDHHYLSPDTRDSLTTLCMAMEACKDETDRYNDVISECQSLLGASVPGKRLRTEFINLGRRAAASGSE